MEIQISQELYYMLKGITVIGIISFVISLGFGIKMASKILKKWMN